MTDSAPVATFPPAGSVPPEKSSFVGRAEEVHALETLLESARLVTIVGPGGVGKTRTSVRVATQLLDTMTGGTWFVDLAPLRNPAFLAETVAAAMQHITDGRDRSLEASIARFIGEERVLLVLDNCEQFVDACGAFCASLLASCPQLRILATSRQRLDVVGETVMTLGPLPVDTTSDTDTEPPAAVALFVHRARETIPQFVADHDTMTLIGEICRYLDGLPLAIELAVVRLRVLSVQQLRDRINTRILTRGLRDAPLRHRTLLAAIEWSYDLCSPGERLLWSRLTVFAGGCQLDSAEAVCAGAGVEPAVVADLLQSLIEKSIVVRSERDGVAWFSMLTTFHEFGAQLLAGSGELAERARRCADWYLTLTRRAEREWIGPRQDYWIARMYRELPNLRPVLSHCLDSADAAGAATALDLLVAGWWVCWYMVGRQHEQLGWLDKTIAAAPADHPLRGRALAIRAYLSGHLSPDSRELTDAEADVRGARESATRHGDRRGLLFADFVEGAAADAQDQPGRAVDAFERVLAAATEESDQDLRIWASVELAGVACLDGDDVRAEAAYAQTNELCRTHGAIYERHLAAFVLALADWRRGRYAEAAPLYQESLRLIEPLGNPMSIAICVDMLGGAAAVVKRDFQLAAYLAGAASMLWRRAGTDASAFPMTALFVRQAATATREKLGEHSYGTFFAHGRVADPEVAVAIALGRREFDPRPTQTLASLTAREVEIAWLVAEGLSNRRIAERFVLSVRTVEGHVERIRHKLGLTSRTQIAIWMAKQTRTEPDAGTAR